MASLQEGLPKTHRALVLSSTSEPPKVEIIPTPQPTPGSAVVRVVVASIVSYMREVYNGKRNYRYAMPLVIGTSAIGRIAAVGSDATLLKVGQLVHVDSTIRGRDDPSAIFLSGISEGHTEGSKKLMHGEWRDSTYAEYAKVPLENCNALDETRLLGKIDDGGLGYSVESLAYMSPLLVPYGGLRDINLMAGETVIIAPATGAFGGAAVLVALAMGARVIAMGRDLKALKRIAATSERVEYVQITGDIQAEVAALQKFGEIDAFFDISPPFAFKSTHIKSSLIALKHAGKVSLMGGFREDIPIPHSVVMFKDLQLKGKWMYERDAIKGLIKMIQIGVLKLDESAGIKTVGKFGLEDWDSAFTAAEENAGMGMQALFAP